jgi:acetyl/propionyl-CoA carboxylase alpha subunit
MALQQQRRLQRVSRHLDSAHASAHHRTGGLRRVLIANRGEIAIRLARACAELGIESVMVFGTDEGAARHRTAGTRPAVALPGTGSGAYVDRGALLAAALREGCDGVAPGYGFLSEDAPFAAQCEGAGLAWVGPRSATIALFGDKTAARALAREARLPLLEGSAGAVDEGGAAAFLATLGGAPMMLKALAGGGGRGMRVVRTAAELPSAFARCTSEAAACFGGDGRVFAERLLERARHIEVQVLGDGTGGVSHLFERDCSLQRQRQKVLEVAPAPGMHAALRARLVADALALCARVDYRGAGTVEFLVEAALGAASRHWFLELNPRLQVEHTVTEELLGVDIAAATLRIAGGATLADLGLTQAHVAARWGAALPAGCFAVQARVCAETMAPDGTPRPVSGVCVGYREPGGIGVRVDSCGFPGFRPSPAFDSLVAKVVCRSSSSSSGSSSSSNSSSSSSSSSSEGGGGSEGSEMAPVLARVCCALREFDLTGLPTNVPFLLRLLEHEGVRGGRWGDSVHTRFIEQHMADLLVPEEAPPQPADPLGVLSQARGAGEGKAQQQQQQQQQHTQVRPAQPAPPGTTAQVCPLLGVVVSVAVSVGDAVAAGAELAVVSAMKMEHVVTAAAAGVIARIEVVAGDTVPEGAAVAFLRCERVSGDGDGAGGGGAAAGAASDAVDLEYIRPDLAALLERKELLTDTRRAAQKQVLRRRKLGKRTARENVADLLDAGSFREYGALVVAGQTKRRSVGY